MIYKFNPDSKSKLDDLKNCKAYVLYHKPLGDYTNDEKLWVTTQVNTNSYFKYAIPLMGWCFNFIDKLKKFWVKLEYGDLYEYYAVDKESLIKYIKEHCCQEVTQILEIE